MLMFFLHVSDDSPGRSLILKNDTLRTVALLLASEDTMCRRHAAAVTDSLSKHPHFKRGLELRAALLLP